MTSKEKLKVLINKTDLLILKKVKGSSPELKTWKNQCLLFLSKEYGNDSEEYRLFNKLRFDLSFYMGYETEDDCINKCREDLIVAKSILTNLYDDMNDSSQNKQSARNKVFIVHGHDEALKYNVSNCIRKLGLEPVILHEQINSSDTIIEKLEKYGSEAAAAIILFTPDDFGQAKNEDNNKQRARQNVVFEAGFFIGLLGRNKTMLIVSDKNIELPGDLQGIVYSDKNSIELEIARELKNMGFDVDLNKLF